VFADTIRLKDGSVIRGKSSVQERTIHDCVGSGARGRKSQITVYMEDVDSIDFDSIGANNSTVPNNDTVNKQPTGLSAPDQQPAKQPTYKQSTDLHFRDFKQSVGLRLRSSKST